MAGAGFKTFNTGDVLTASDVNTYLMQQTVMVFASAAARTTALGANVAEGMLSYLKDTDQVEVYNGTSWVASDDPNAIQNTIVDAKGDIITATANDTPARLAVGSNGQTLVADSSQTTGLGWANNFAAGKNAIINGAFDWNQRAFTSTTTSGTYGFDRWKLSAGVNGVCTYSAQTFTAGTAPVAGYEGKNFARIVSTSQSANTDFSAFLQPIESVRTFAGQTVTFSFWAKASTGTPNIGISIGQNFGTGGSPSSTVVTSPAVTAITSSWARYSFTITVPSISGKTLGTNGNDNLEAWIFTSCGTSISALGYAAVGLQNATIDIWGVQVEAGSVATAFQTATGTIQGELAACQRYYFRNTGGATYSVNGQTFGLSATSANGIVYLPVQMRTKPTSVEYANLVVNEPGVTNQAITGMTLDTNDSGPNIASVSITTSSGLTASRAGRITNNNNTAGYLGFSAEL